MQTTRAKLHLFRKISGSRVVPSVVAAGLGLAALVPARAEYSWTPDGDAPWVWNLSNYTFTENGTKVVWGQGSGDGVAIFGNTAARDVTVGSDIAGVTELRFTEDNYSLLAGSNGSLTFSAGSPSIVINPGVTAQFDVQLSSESELTLTGGGVFQLRAGGSATTDNVIADTTAINLDGVTMDLASRSETVGGFTLTSGTVRNGTITADSYSLRGGTMDARLGFGTVTVNAKSGVTVGDAGTFDPSTILRVEGGQLNLGSAAHNQTVNTVKLVDGTIIGGGVLNATASFWLENGSVSSRLGGTGSLTKATTGVVTLTGDNSYTGATTVNMGTLQLTGGASLSGSSKVTVNSGGILAGEGNASGTVAVRRGGILSPGIGGVGTLRSGSQTWSSGGIYNWDIADLTDGALYQDRLGINGSLTINSVSADKFILNVFSTSAVPTSSYSWTLATTTTGLNWAQTTPLNDLFAINLGGSWSTLDVSRFSVTRDGLNLDLTYAVPEPGDYAVVLGAITLGLVGFRRWRRVVRMA